MRSALPALRRRLHDWRWPGLAYFRLRLFFRGVFLLLALATLAIALSVLQDEKQLSDRSYREGFAKTMGQVAAQLRNPAGQLALLNPPPDASAAPAAHAGAVHPLVLPFAALDFDDRNKGEQAVEMAGCARQYPGDAALCVATETASGTPATSALLSTSHESPSLRTETCSGRSRPARGCASCSMRPRAIARSSSARSI